MTVTLRSLLLPLLAAPVLALAACGGGGSDEDTIRGIVEDSSSKPASLCDNLAAAPLKTLGGKDKCLDLAKDQKGTDATVSDVKIDGDKATVKAKNSTGEATINLVKEGGDWKIAVLDS